jgi:RNA polymerase sigma-70 factor (ECF subfamily)
MGPSPTGNSIETDRLLRQAAAGAVPEWGALLERHRKRLRRMVVLRFDQRLQGRLDPGDVIQKAFLEASARLAEYLQKPAMPFFLWLRFLTAQKLMELHRHHLGTKMRDAAREISLYRGALPVASSAVLAAQLVGRDTRPSEAAARAERKLRLQEALNRMDPVDREVLALRHFEQLNNAETAEVLGLQESAASKRYVRALKKLKDILTDPGGRSKGIEP